MPHSPQNYSLARIKGGFQRALPLHQYNQLVNFVTVRKLKAECPGHYVCYRWYHNRVAVATSETNIDEWLVLHGLEPRGNVKVEFNKTGLQTKTTGQNGYSKGFSTDAMVDSHTLQKEIVHKLNNGATLTSIADELGCSPANIHYHRNKYNQRMAKQHEVDS